MYKAVIFDLGKVIVPFDLARGFAALQRHCSLTPRQIRERIAGTDIVTRFESGQIRPEDFVSELSALLGMNVGYEKFCDMWSSIFLPDAIMPEHLLEGLRRHYRLLLLSNTNAIHFAMIRDRYPLLRHFEAFILSYEVGAMKPDRRIYEAAVERAECRPNECFFTDDIASYVEGARRIGIDAVQFESVGQIERELSNRGIVWD